MTPRFYFSKVQIVEEMKVLENVNLHQISVRRFFVFENDS